jgi:hypothetical protein
VVRAPGSYWVEWRQDPGRAQVARLAREHGHDAWYLTALPLPIMTFAVRVLSERLPEPRI